MFRYRLLILAIGFVILTRPIHAGNVPTPPEPFPVKVTVTRPEKPPIPKEPEPFPVKVTVTRPEKPPIPKEPEPFPIKVTVTRPSKPSKGKIKIIEATYGWNCKNFKPWEGKPNTVSRNNDKKIRPECDGKSTCKYRIDYKLIGDPAYGCQKEYEVTYKCMPGGKTFTKKVEKEAGWGKKSVVLSCP
jgi:hypothetical protein